MVGHRRHYGLIAIALLALPVFGGVDNRGYLPTVGPVALRYSLLPAAPTIAFVPPAPPLPTAPEPIKAGKSGVLAPAVASSPEPSAVVNQVSSAPPEPARPDEVVSPQMLLKYFNKSTNGPASSVIAPLDFTPPRSAESPSSKATYSTGQ